MAEVTGQMSDQLPRQGVDRLGDDGCANLGRNSRSLDLIATPDEMRGRVMSMFMLSFIGAMPIGNLIAGAASHRFGVQHTLATGGLIIAVFVVVVTWRNPKLREI